MAVQRLRQPARGNLRDRTRTRPSVDVVLSAHTHRGYRCVVNDRLVIQGASFGRLVSVIDIAIDRVSGEMLRGQNARPQRARAQRLCRNRNACRRPTRARTGPESRRSSSITESGRLRWPAGPSVGWPRRSTGNASRGRGPCARSTGRRRSTFGDSRTGRRRGIDQSRRDPDRDQATWAEGTVTYGDCTQCSPSATHWSPSR